LSADDYVELLPVSWNAINKYGIKLNKRTYDCKALNSYRRQHSGVERKKGLWEVHYDPYDVTRIWVRNHHDGGWITVPWKQTPQPDEHDEAEEPAAKVIPLPVFDARKEAEQWRF
jgi:hypothetical protein